MALVRAAAMVLAGFIFYGVASATAEQTDVQDDRLSASVSTKFGQPIRFPDTNESEITAVIVTLKPGQATDRHQQVVPLLGYILEGELTVTSEDHGTRVFRAGDALTEAMDVWHLVRNTGEGDLRVLAVFMGEGG